MKDIAIRATDCLPDRLHLGRQGENRVRRILFDVGPWVEEYGDGAVYLTAQRQGDPAPYPVAAAFSGRRLIWEITDADTAVDGYGYAELQYRSGGVVRKSRVFGTLVKPALGPASPDPPPPYQSWVDDVLQASADAQDARDAAQGAAASAKDSETAAGWSAETAERAANNLRALLLGGAAGEVLSKASDADLDLCWARRSFVYEQTTASAAWEITHPLGGFPAVTIVDSGGSAVVGDVTYLDEQHITVSFSAAFSGKVYLN